jgi:hypothetical protein
MGRRTSSLLIYSCLIDPLFQVEEIYLRHPSVFLISSSYTHQFALIVSLFRSVPQQDHALELKNIRRKHFMFYNCC